jgi:hypothetical protein
MKRTEIELVCRDLVKYVEKHPNCSRLDATKSINLKYPTTHAWERIKHLFDYDQYSGKSVTYKRNKLPYGHDIKKRIYHEDPKPSLAMIALSRQMKDLINEHHGITGAELREALDINESTFKRASRLLDVDRQRSYARGMAYYPKGTMPKTVKIERAPKLVIKPIKVKQLVEIAKTDMPILTQWRITPPWMESRV